MTGRIAKGAAILAVYGALVVWLTWPLGAHLDTHLPDTGITCRYDSLLLAWALSHQSRALSEAPAKFPHANAYYPAQHALFYGEAGFGALPYFMPVFLATGNPALALNWTFLVCVALTAFSLHLVLYRWTGSHLAGVMAAWIFLTRRWVLWGWVPAAPSYAVLQYLPLVLFLSAAPPARFRPALLLGFLVVQSFTSFYVAAAAMAPLAVLAGFRLLRPTTRAAGLRLVGVLAVATVALVGVYSGSLIIRRDNPLLHKQTVWRKTVHWPLRFPEDLLNPHAPIQVPLVPLSLIGIGAASIVWRRVRHGTPAGEAWAHGTLWLAVGVLASPTPTILWYGTPTRLPHAVLGDWLSVYEIVRVPLRMGIASLFGLALLGGVAFGECARRLSGWNFPVLGRLAAPALAGVLMVSIYDEYSRGVAIEALHPKPLPAAYPLWRPPAPDSPLMAILRQPGGPLLELPIGAKLAIDLYPDAPLQARAMYRSIFHGRPLLNGYNGYWPAGFPERMALARRLPDAEALTALRHETGLELILVHVRLFGGIEREVCRKLARAGPPPPICATDFGAEERRAWLEVMARGRRDDLRLVVRDGGDLLFAVGDPVAGEVSAHASPR
jgi:hypothetical protein